ncbi:hypothetical protein [Bacillus paranthracis]|uniref:hypothetical protein n=1 Tax=Bacillus paranthracis TaxID=2026186 RepID=UPI003D20F0E7
MKFFKIKYIPLPIIALFIIAIIVSLIQSPSAAFNIGSILGSAVVSFLTWSIILTLTISVMLLILGIVRKVKRKETKKVFISSISSLGISAVLFISLGIISVAFQEQETGDLKEIQVSSKPSEDATEPDNFNGENPYKSTSKIPNDVIMFVNTYRQISKSANANALSIPEVKDLSKQTDEDSNGKKFTRIPFVYKFNKEDTQQSLLFSAILSNDESSFTKITYSGVFNFDTFLASLSSFQLLNDEQVKILINNIAQNVENKNFKFEETIQTNEFSITFEINVSQFIPPMSFIIERK